MVQKQKMTRRATIRGLIIKLLKTSAIETADLVGLIFETKYKGFQILKRGDIKRTVRELLERDELIKQDKEYSLSGYGTVQALPQINKFLVKDGQVRVLVFDIPEIERNKRDVFREHIKKLGFKMHQQSVWVSDYDCENWMLKIIDYHKVGDYVSLYIGKHIW